MTDARLVDLSYEECVDLLRAGSTGRISVVVNDFPVIVPINYRLVEASGRPWIALRTRAGNVIERSTNVAFEIDQIDPVHQGGWSVLVRGTLHHVDQEAADFRGRFDPEPWLVAERNAWLVVEPFSITGRRLESGEPDWAFPDIAYL